MRESESQIEGKKTNLIYGTHWQTILIKIYYIWQHFKRQLHCVWPHRGTMVLGRPGELGLKQTVTPQQAPMAGEYGLTICMLMVKIVFGQFNLAIKGNRMHRAH